MRRFRGGEASAVVTPSERRLIRAERRTEELITIHEYDPRWPALFAAERAEIANALGDMIAIEHMGSTAVPGLEAKPIVDVIASVAQLALTESQLAALARVGYEYLGECGVPGRAYFRKREPSSFNLHVVQYESSLWDHNLLFRDYLQAHPEEARRYGILKRKLARDAGHSLLVYSDRKSRFIARALARASGVAAATDRRVASDGAPRPAQPVRGRPGTTIGGGSWSVPVVPPLVAAPFAGVSRRARMLRRRFSSASGSSVLRSLVSA